MSSAPRTAISKLKAQHVSGLQLSLVAVGALVLGAVAASGLGANASFDGGWPLRTSATTAHGANEPGSAERARQLDGKQQATPNDFLISNTGVVGAAGSGAGQTALVLQQAPRGNGDPSLAWHTPFAETSHPDTLDWGAHGDSWQQPNSAPAAFGSRIPTGSTDSSSADSSSADSSSERSSGSASVKNPRTPSRSAQAGLVAKQKARANSLQEETLLLEEARSKLGREPSQALLLSLKHRQKFAQGQLLEQRRMIHLEALLRLGRDVEAQALARQIQSSLYSKRASTLLARYGLRSE